MSGSHRYAMLLSSLPYHGPLFGAKQTPLSRIRLRQRLALLEPLDAACLRTVSELLEWTHQDMDRTDEEVATRAKQAIPGICHAFVRDLVTWRLEMRTLVSALRRRHRGDPAAGVMKWGFGRWLGQLQRHWNEPAFRLERVFPWLPEASRLMDSGDAVGLERLLLGTVWDHLERLSDGHHFDFEAMVIYTLRWDLTARWTAYNGDEAAQRFDGLIAAGLADVDLDELAT